MAIAAGQAGRLGRYEVAAVAGEQVRAFVPPPLPPDPPLSLAPLQRLMEQANQALGRLDGVASILPAPLFLYMYIRKEALLSSQIEGTQSSFSDLLLFEAEELPGVPLDDVREVSNYVAAINLGLERLRGGFPLSLRLIREIHGVLLVRGRGDDKDPGEFRRSQNWVGGSRPGNALYVPPPPHLVLPCMGALETFIHADAPGLPTVIKAGLVHVQFESIHPFLDGNGRLGRLLITFLLCESGVLREPLLYLSLHLKRHRETYYALLQQVRTHGTWETWLEFFLTGIIETADQAAATARSILALFDADRRRIEQLGRPASSALRVHELLQRKPLVTIPDAARELSLSQPTVTTSLDHLSTLGITREATGRRRGRLFAYDRYLNLLGEGTEPLPR
ncbi:MAG TPA: Fic family protein [Acetobacteraceae bacterium]|nr:Fic family protein [Acetobacteraceae bacterium]